jgi:hypothetical protein
VLRGAEDKTFTGPSVVGSKNAAERRLFAPCHRFAESRNRNIAIRKLGSGKMKDKFTTIGFQQIPIEILLQRRETIAPILTRGSRR